MNGDLSIDLTDAILTLKFLSGMHPSEIRSEYPSLGADVNGDGRIGLSEAIYILQKAAGLR